MKHLVMALALGASSLAAPPATARDSSCTPRVARVAAGYWEARPVKGLRGVGSTALLAADQHDPRLIVVADLEGVVVTRDGGCTWRRAAEYTDLAAPHAVHPVEAVVAGTGTRRSLHVLVEVLVTNHTQWMVLSSFDDGATWTALDAPLAAAFQARTSTPLAASPGDPGVVYLLARHPGPTGGIYAGDGRGVWGWRSAAAFSAAPGTCAPGGPCLSRLVDSLFADPQRKGVLWGFSGSSAAPDALETLGVSRDGGASWTHRPVPALGPGETTVDVAPGEDGVTVTLFDDFDGFAVSDDGGRSWQIGDYPKVVSGDRSSAGVHAVEQFDAGSRVAIVPGIISDWRGNVLVFDGRRWTNVSPPELAGYGRTDDEGRRLFFTDVAGTDGPLLALTSRGELMTFRP